MYTITFSNSPLQKITVSASAYEMGSIRLFFSPKYQIDQICQSLCSRIKSDIINFRNILICNDIAHLRVVIEHLISIGILTESDKPSVFSLVHQIEEIVQQRSSLQGSIRPVQTEVLLSVADVYIDDIIEQCNDYHHAMKLLRAAFYVRGLDIKVQIESFIAKYRIETNVSESVISLWKICHGQANLETTYLRLGKKLPELLVQRSDICANCIQKLKEKFTNLDDENQMYMVLGLLLFKAEGKFVASPLADSDNMIAEALKGESSFSLETRIAFSMVNCSYIESLVRQTLRVMEIGRRATLNIKRIKALQQKFNSQVLQKCLDSLTVLPVEEQNAVFQSLRSKDNDALRAALTCENVNQYFRDGRTPLIVAIKECEVSTVKLVLSFKPDVDQKNAYQAFNPMCVAINKPSAEITDLLLKAGASVFFPCGLLLLKTHSFPQRERVISASALAIAIENYLADKTEERANIVRLLLYYGAGIGFGVHNVFVGELLGNAVIIGSNFPILRGVDPITTADEFKERVGTTQYPHWKMVCERVRNCPLFQENTALLAEMAKISDHINKTLVASSTHNGSLLGRGSPVIAAGDAHEELVRRIEPITIAHPKKFEPFLEAIRERDYSKALRRACTSTDPQVLMLIKILLEYKDRLLIQLDEQAGDKNRAAIHYAALKGNQAVYDLLVQQGADVSLKDADNFSAEEYQAQQEQKLRLV